MISDNPEQFLIAVKTVALKAETSFEAFHLIEWFKANVPYMEHGETNFILFHALDSLAHYWDEYGCAEDELLPALSFAYTFAAHGWMMSKDLDLLIQRQALCDEMIKSPCLDRTEDISYEDFCDKYASELND